MNSNQVSNVSVQAQQNGKILVITAREYPSFLSIQRLVTYLSVCEWNDSPLQGRVKPNIINYLIMNILD